LYVDRNYVFVLPKPLVFSSSRLQIRKKLSTSVAFGNPFLCLLPVPDKESWDLEVVVVGRTVNLGTGNLEWGGNGEGLRKGRSVHE
jgi:hypothetical protein